MSKQAVMELLAAVARDPDLERSLQAAVEHRQDRTAAIVGFASAHGRRFAAAELDEVLAAAHAAGGELSLADLEAVSGGLGPQPEPPDKPPYDRSIRLRIPPWLWRGIR